MFERLKFDLNSSEDLRPARFLDAIIGTGTGGIAAILLGKLGMTATEAIDAYSTLEGAMARTKATNDSERASNTARFREAFVSILRAHKMENLFMHDEKPNTATCKTIVCAMNKANMAGCHLIRSYQSRGMTSPKCSILDAACASINDPEMYDPVLLGAGHSSVTLINAMMGYANPIKELMRETQTAPFGGENSQISTVISLGAGKHGPLEASRLSDAIRNIAAGAERTHQEMQGRLRVEGIYFRFNVDQGIQPDDDISTVNGKTRAYVEIPDVNSAIDNSLTSLRHREERLSAKQINTIKVVEVGFKPRPALVPNFIGREDILQGLRRTHISPHTPMSPGTPTLSVLYGLGGSGKTSIALRFCLDFEQANPEARVYFLDARSESKLTADLEAIARSCGSKFKGKGWRNALEYFAGLPQFLIIMDNADDTTLRISQFFPQCSHGHIIITSRNATYSQLARTSNWEVRDLSPEQARDLLLTDADYEKTETNVEDASKIVEALGCLPLGVAHAAAYIHTHRCLSTYLQTYQQSSRQLLAYTLPHDLNESVATTINMSLEKLPQESKDILRILSFFSVSSIAHSILIDAHEHQFQRRSQSGKKHSSSVRASVVLSSLLCPNEVWSEYDINARLLPCIQHSLLRTVTSANNTKFYSMHVLVQSYLQTDTSPIHNISPESLAIRLLDSSIKFGEWQSVMQPQLLPHVKLVPKGKTLDPGAHGDFAKVLQQAGEYQAALIQVQIAVKGWENKLGERHGQTLAAMQNMACLLDFSGRIEESLELNWKILELRKRHSPQDHPSTLLCMSAISQALTNLGRHEEAAKMAEEALEAQKKVLGLTHAETLMTMTRLGWTYDNLGHHTRALDIKMEALETSKRMYSEDHIATLKAMGGVGISLCKLGRFEDAYKLQKRIVDLRERKLRIDHPDTISSMSNLSTTLLDMGRREEALEMCSKVVSLSKKHLGETHPRTLRASYQLLFAYDKFRMEDEMRRSLGPILTLHESVHGRDHRHTIQIRRWEQKMAARSAGPID